MSEFVVGVTGASGTLFARDFIRGILTVPQVSRLHVIVSRFAMQTLRAELGSAAGDDVARRELAGEASPRVVFHQPENMAAPVSSGSYLTGGMAIIPCSMGTLGAIASGVSTNLIQRCADVTLKERRPLVLAVREAPLNRVHLKNLLAASEAGAVIYPLVPAFYTRPKDIDELLEQTTARILDQIPLPHSLGRRWGS